MQSYQIHQDEIAHNYSKSNQIYRLSNKKEPGLIPDS